MSLSSVVLREPRFFGFPKAAIAIAEQTVDHRVKWIDLHGFLERAARLAIIFRGMVDAAQLHIGIDVIRIHVERFLAAAARPRPDG